MPKHRVMFMDGGMGVSGQRHDQRGFPRRERAFRTHDEVNTGITMFRHQNTGHINIVMSADRCFKNVAQFK